MKLKEGEIKMKATLEFNLPEERAEYEMYTSVYNMYNVLWETYNNLRHLYKHVDVDQNFEEPSELLDRIREDFHDSLLDNNVEI